MTGWDTTALRGSPLVRTIETHEELGSTNDRAKDLAAAKAELPVLILADRQTAGRGRGDNRWWASDGALTFSLLMNPASYGLSPEAHGLISLATAVAVIDAVGQTAGLTAGYKWPNDVLLDGKKLAGVLLEAPRPDRLVLGVGINVENRIDDAPDEVQARAATLADSAATRQQVLEAFLGAFHQRLTQLASGDARPVEAARRACILTGNEIALRDGGRVVEGQCCGLADDGAIRLLSAGEESCYRAGTIERW